jgi:hypothetical protein
MSSRKNITTLLGKETRAFNLTKVGSYDVTVKTFLNSRLIFNMLIVLCVYVQFMIDNIKNSWMNNKNT